MLIGHLGADPVIKSTATGKTVTVFNIATNENYRMKDIDSTIEMQKKTVWHRVTAWGKLGELVAQAILKGDKVFVEGALDKRHYEDPDGKKQTITEIKAFYVEQMKSLAPIKNQMIS